MAIKVIETNANKPTHEAKDLQDVLNLAIIHGEVEFKYDGHVYKLTEVKDNRDE